MTKIDIFSGFLGAGKTTLIRKLINEAYRGEKIVLIENEFGEIAIDGGFLQDAGIEITEMSQGCICCSLVGDFREALKKVIDEMKPERIIIEPSGVGKLSDVIKAVQAVDDADIVLNSFTTVCDANKCKMYIKNFGEFYNDQVEHANSIVLSRTKNISEEKLADVVALLREKNAVATIITTDWEEITGQQILETMEHKNTLEAELEKLKEEAHHHAEHEECDDPNCPCHHHHDEEDEGEHEHHHHHHHHHDDDDEECECCCHHDEEDEEEHEHHHHHHHHHDDDEECECCCHHDNEDEEEHEHHHHHHHHHHADEIFSSWGLETAKKYSVDEIKQILNELDNAEKYGIILRAKGIVDSNEGQWIYFDYVPEESNVRTGAAMTMGRFCVIGSKMNEEALKELFKA